MVNLLIEIFKKKYIINICNKIFIKNWKFWVHFLFFSISKFLLLRKFKLVTVKGATFCGLSPVKGPTERYGGNRFWLIDKLFGNWDWLYNGFGVIKTVSTWFCDMRLNGFGFNGGMYSLNCTGTSSVNGGGAKVVAVFKLIFDGDVTYGFSVENG